MSKLFLKFLISARTSSSSTSEQDAVFARLNEEIHSRNQSKSLTEVLEDYPQSWKTLMTFVETLTQEDLDRSIPLDWALNPVHGWNVVAWRIWHAEHHGKQIEAWLDPNF